MKAKIVLYSYLMLMTQMSTGAAESYPFDEEAWEMGGAERCEMPWGGRNQSGYGRELSPQSLEVFLNTKAVHISR